MPLENPLVILEGALLTAGRPLTVREMRLLFSNAYSRSDILKWLGEIQQKWSGLAVHLTEVAGGWRFSGSSELEPYLRRLTTDKPPRYSRSFLETLAIIAYKQPITRAELEAVRGINSDYAITTLQSLDMITPCGRKDVPGKPILYATTDNFLKRFKLKSLSDLPDYDELMEKIAEINAANEASSYLYEKEVYDPEKEAAEDEAEEKREKANSSEGGFELPDFLKDIEIGRAHV